MKQKLKIIITGFDVFGSLTYNPSKIIINFINEFVINKKKENANCESGMNMNACVDFFINNRNCLKCPSTDYPLDIREEVKLHKDKLERTAETRHFCHNNNNQNNNNQNNNNQNNNNNNNENAHKNVKERVKEKEQKDQFILLDKLKDCNMEDIKNHLTALSYLFKENCFEFVESEICCVSKEAVDKMIHKIYKKCNERKDTKIEDENRKEKSSKNQIVVIHMGVCAMSDFVTLESTGTDLLIVNPETTSENANSKNLSIKEHIHTSLNLENIIKRLNEEKNCNVNLSHDSGTYFFTSH